MRALRDGAPAVSAMVVGAVIRGVTRRRREIEGRVDREVVAPSRPPPRADGVGAPERSGLQRLFDRLRGRA
jgi:hypothetical protein